MHFGLFAEFWWVVILAMAAVLAIFVFVAGRGAEGGLSGRASVGWSKWKDLSRKAADLLARIILTVFYFTFVMPFGLIRTHLVDPLGMKKHRQPRTWLARQTRDLSLDDARRQF